MQKNSLFIFSLEFPPLLGGAGNFSRDLIYALSKKFDKIFVLTIKSSFARSNKNIVYLNGILKINLWYIWAPIFSYFHLLFFGYRYKKILISEYYAFLCFPFFLTRFYRWNIYYVLHGTEIEHIARPTQKRDNFFNAVFGLKRRLNYCKFIVCVSNNYYLKCEIALPEFVDKLVVINNSVNFGEFDNEEFIIRKKEDAASNKFMILVVSRLVNWKRVDTVIDNFIRFHKIFNNSQLLIAGDGPEFYSLVNMSKKGVEESIVFLGNLSREELVKIYYNSSVLVSFSDDNESFGLNVLEANFCGLPVIGSEIFVKNGVLVDNLNGLLAEESEFSIFEKLIELYSDQKLFWRLSNNCRKFVLEKFDFNSMIEQYMILLSKE